MKDETSSGYRARVLTLLLNLPIVIFSVFIDFRFDLHGRKSSISYGIVALISIVSYLFILKCLSSRNNTLGCKFILKIHDFIWRE